MRIYFCDGSFLDCISIEICGDTLYVDEYRIVNICDVEKIVSE